MRSVRGVAQHYDWGDPVAIPHILGVPADGQPWAEWWLGTHPSALSLLDDGAALSSVAGELPYLLKLLAAAYPLSLQTHPNTATAAAGFAREDSAGVALTDPQRIYRDPLAKPELLCALTAFDTLCGFRPVAATEALLRDIGAYQAAFVLRDGGLEAVVADLYLGALDAAAVVTACAQHRSPEATLVTRLNAMYPNEPSVAVTLLLNRVVLQPGEAIFLGPGNLHAYLHGVGVEVMGASDNVVRGGLTSKHVDVPELLAVLRYEELASPVVCAVEVEPNRWCYPTAGAPFELWRFEVSDRMTHTSQGHELLLCTSGAVGPLHHGDAGYLAAGETVVLEGPATVYRVATPHHTTV